MIKTITLVFLCNLINLNFITAQKCYVCDNTCDRPGATDLKDCSDAENGGTSGKTFVQGAIKGNAVGTAYTDLETELSNYAENILAVNKSLTSWKSLTQWVKFILNIDDFIKYF